MSKLMTWNNEVTKQAHLIVFCQNISDNLKDFMFFNRNGYTELVKGTYFNNKIELL